MGNASATRATNRAVIERLTSLMHAANAYEGASTRNASFGTWQPALRSVDAEVFRDSATVRSRARDLVRNNPTARQAVRISRQGTIGAHLRLVLRPGYKYLGITHEDSVLWARTVERVWEQYAHGPSCWLDAGRRFSFSELMGLVHDADFVDGECLTVAEWRDDGAPWQTCFQVIDVDRLGNPNGMPDTVYRKGGVELDKFGAPLGYHIRQAHPGDIALLGARPWVWDFVPRETPWFRPIVMHSFDPLRAGQTRGMSEFASVIHALKLGKEYAEQELANATVRAGFVAVLTSALNYEKAAEIFGANLDPSADGSDPLTDMALHQLEQTAAYYNELNLQVNGQKIPKLSPGDDLKFLGNNTPGNGYADFIRSQILNVAAGLGVDPTALSQNYREAGSYSSAKQSWAINGRGHETRRARLNRMVATPMFAAWLEEAVMKGRVPMPKGLTIGDFYEARDALCNCAWITAGKPIIEPLRERQAQQLGMLLGTETLESICSEEGESWEENLEQRARENLVATELGLTLPGMIPLQAATTNVPEVEEAPEEEEPDGKKT
jgi:lambda family phage portal protein